MANDWAVSGLTRQIRWSEKGRWQRIFEVLSKDADFEYLMTDGSIARVHQHGVPKKMHRKQERLASHEVV